MATPETIGAQNLAAQEATYNLDSSIDPLIIAAQAVAKLKAAGLSGYVNFYEQNVDIDDNVSYIYQNRQGIPRPDISAILKGESTAQHKNKEILSSQEKNMLTPKQLELMEQYLPLVDKIAKRIIKDYSFHSLEDAIADGYVGLVKAISNYDPSKVPEGANGGSYIYSTIFGSILRGLRDWHGRSRNGGPANRKPSVINGSATSLEENLGEDGGELFLHDIVASDTDVAGDAEHEVMMSSILTAVSGFSERDKEIFIRRIYMGQSQAQIGIEVGVGQMHICRLLKRMEERLSNNISGNELA